MKRQLGYVVRALWLLLTLLFVTTTAYGQDEEKECSPACRLGFECKDGTCVRQECRPACRKDFICVEGECKSRCNPACASNERCTPEGECVRLAGRKWNDSDDDDSQSKGEARTPAQTAKPDAYHPSVIRAYVGPMLWAISLNGVFATDVGATIAFVGHLDDARIFFMGMRLGIVGDSSGILTMFDLDFGLRPRLFTNADVGVSLVIGGGLGAGVFFAGPTVGTFHMPLRIGPCFDFGAFTFELLGGPALFAAKNAFGAFESMLEVGARF